MGRGLLGFALVAVPLTALALAAQSTPVSIWPSNPTPAAVDLNDGQPLELGVKFRSDVAGQITAIRFYKGPAATGTHIGNVWSSTGTNLGTVTFTGETASGWQQMSFAAPIAIAADTTYVASYFAADGTYSATNNGLAAAVDNAPLHALADGAGGGNGVYLYTATSAFPTQTYQASNYWVDVVFVAASSGTPAPSPGTPPTSPYTPTGGSMPTCSCDSTIGASGSAPAAAAALALLGAWGRRRRS
jgi:MYXO-CTERM domain-containing protein